MQPLPPLSRRFLVTALAGVALVGAQWPGAAEAGARPFETAIFHTDSSEAVMEAPLAFNRIRAAGATAVRLQVRWSSIAPGGTTKPAGFDPRNPADNAYDWSRLDRQVEAATAAGLRPIVGFSGAPLWAQREPSSFRPGNGWPDADEFGHFAVAAARRYSGRFAGLPRVRNWLVWNEPNHYNYLLPQYSTPISQPVTTQSRPVSPTVYRPMANAFAAAVHSVNPTNIVIAGALAPFARFDRYSQVVAPLRFMRALLCMTRRSRPLRGCHARTQFDVWSAHPYTQGGPTHHALQPDNVSLGDLPDVRRLLRAATRAGHVVSRHKPKLWVTEFSWDTRPPDSGGVPLKRHARWLSEAFYRMWRNGVSLVTWFQLRDGHSPGVSRTREFTSGLYFRCDGGLSCDRRKRPSFASFRFPFVAFPAGRRVLVWGRTPAGRRARVTVEQRRGRRWQRLARLRTDRYGVFMKRVKRLGRGSLRARRGRIFSVPFSPKRTRDVPVNPFGGDPCARPEREPQLCGSR
jgi:hypothetical protein